MAGIGSRIFAIAAPLLLALTLTSCGGSDGTPVDPRNDGTENGGGSAAGGDNTAPQAPETPPPERLALHEAQRRGLVEYEVTGRGASSGDSLNIRLRRTTAQPLSLYIAPGTVLGSRSRGVQRMVARAFSGAETIDLADDEFQDFTLEAYCLDIDLDNPSAANRFAAQSIDERAAAILVAANSEGLGVAATQAAIWMDEGATGEDIAAIFPATPEDLDAARRLLTRLPPRTRRSPG